jgi:hypothetical protein
VRRPTTIVCLAFVSALLVTGLARAEGGASISAAPSLVSGQQEFGSLSTSYTGQHCDERVYRSWWLMPVTSGDVLQIDWEAQASGAVLSLFAPGTTDFNYPTTQPVASGGLNTNLKAELTYQAVRAGVMPVEFSSGSGCAGPGAGPYSVTVYVTHSLSVSLRRILSLHRTGALTVTVHNVEGGAVGNPEPKVQVQLRERGSWRSIGTASVSNSVAVIHYTIPTSLRRQKVTLRALATGPGYRPTSSRQFQVRVL